MTKHVRKPVFTFIGTFLALILLSGCIIHVGGSKANANVKWDKDYSATNKALTIGEGKEVGDVSTVNGRLTIEDKVSAQEVSSVNGRINIGANVSVEELSSVNGKLSAKQNFKVEEDLSTVNGSITLMSNSSVGGTISSVNGSINIEDTTVKGDIETVNGNIYLSGNTTVGGDIVYKWNKSNNSYKNSKPTLKISEGVQVKGHIILHRAIDLDFADESLHRKVRKEY